MNVSIVIPNYNGEKILKKNLPTVLAAAKEYTKGKIEIIIADDPSTDDSPAVIDAFIKNIGDKRIIGKTISNKNKKEAGFSKNVNRGVSLATGEILILLNSDVRPHKDFISPLVSHFSDDAVFGVGCMDESVEEGKIVLRGRGVGTWSKGFLMHSAGSLDKAHSLWVSGGSSAFRKSIWEKLQGLDVLYNPFYWEDIDLSYRALKSGYQVLFEKKSVVVHDHAKGAIKIKFKPYQIQKIVYRNQFIFVWKNITDMPLIISHLFWLPYHFVTAAKRKDRAFFVGFFSALFHFSSIMQAREKAKKLFVHKDKTVIRDNQS